MILRDTSTGREYVLRRRPWEPLEVYLERERRFGRITKASLRVDDPEYIERELYRVDDIMTVGGMLAAWSAGRLTDSQVSQLMQLDDDDDLLEIARNNAVRPPGDPPTE